MIYLLYKVRKVKEVKTKKLKKVKKVLDKTKNLWYNKGTKGKQKRKKEVLHYDEERNVC